MAHIVNVAESGEVPVHGVEQPEAGDVRCRKIRQAGASLAAAAREDAAFRGENFDEPPGDAHQVVIGRDIEKRGDVLRIKAEGAGAGSLNPSELQ